MPDITNGLRTNPAPSELADRARAYLSSELYPAIMGGLGVYSLLEMTDAGRMLDLKSMATAVIEHAEAAGWRLELVDGFWTAIGPPVITVTHPADTYTWQVDAPGHSYSTTNEAYVIEDVKRLGDPHGTVVVRWSDQRPTLAQRRAAREV